MLSCHLTLLTANSCLQSLFLFESNSILKPQTHGELATTLNMSVPISW